MTIALNPNSIMELIGTIVVAAALVVSIVTFYITFKRGKKAEHMKIAHDIMRDFSEAEDKILETNPADDKWKLRHLQYLNVFEWLSFLINHGEIREGNIKNYFKPLVIEDYKKVLGLPELESETIRKTSESLKSYTKKGLPNHL